MDRNTYFSLLVSASDALFLPFRYNCIVALAFRIFRMLRGWSFLRIDF